MKKLALGITIFFLSSVALLSFQNCSPAKFSAPSLNFCPEGKVCEEMNFKASATESFPMVKVVFVIDNSFSMEVMQQKLSQSLGPLFEGLRDKTVEFHFLTTTHLAVGTAYGANSLVGSVIGNSPSFVQKLFYSYQLAGNSIYSEAAPTSAALTNLKFNYEFKPFLSYNAVFESQNPIDGLSSDLHRFDVNEDGFLDANDMDLVLFRDLCSSFPACVPFRSFNRFLMQLIGVSQSMAQVLQLQFTAGTRVPFRIGPNQSAGFNRYIMKLVEEQIKQTGTDGSTREVGICNLASVLADEANTFIRPGDKVAFIVLSNEDDQSTAEACLKKISFNGTMSSMQDNCSSGTCDSYRMMVQYKPAPFRVGKCVTGYRDGTTTPILEEYGEPIGLTVCDPNNPGRRACTSTEQQAATNLCQQSNPSFTLNECFVECRTYMNKPYQNKNLSYLMLWNVNQNQCDESQTIYGSGQNYVNYFSTLDIPRVLDTGTCRIDGLRNVVRPYLSPENLANPIFEQRFPVTTNLSDEFIRIADQKLGRSNYYLTAIIHDQQLDSQTGNCESAQMSEVRSFGVKYKELAQRIMGRSNVTSICAPSYSPALTEFQRFAIENVVRDFPMPDLGGRTLVAVVWQRPGQQPSRLSEGDFRMEGNRLIIREGLMAENDQITVILTGD